MTASGEHRDSRPRLPIVKVRDVTVTEPERHRVEQLAAEMLARRPSIASTAFFGSEVASGLGDGAAVLIGDKSEIRLLAPAGQDTLEYRIAMLADDRDLLVLATDRCRAFESYMGGLIGKQPPVVLETRKANTAPGAPSAVRCLNDPGLFGALCRHIVRHNGATLVPYISTGSIWRLARHLNAATGIPITICGPPPNLAQCVNDKIWFAALVGSLLGDRSLPPTRTAYGPAALTSHIHRLAKKWDRLVIKVPDSAGSAGNFPVRSDAIRSLKARQLYRRLQDLMAPVVSREDFPLMVEVWDCDVLANPSVQVWIPEKQQGPPVIEGVFEQILLGERGTFVGAGPGTLETALDERLCLEAMLLSLLLQELGFFGRCSFDAVVASAEAGGQDIHWIECNGRWGGVSLPMTFMNRLFPSGNLPRYAVVQLAELAFTGMAFDAALQAVEPDLYMPGRKGGVVLASPGGLEQGTGLQMIVLGETDAEIRARAERVRRILTGS